MYLIISGLKTGCQQAELLLYLFQAKRSHPDTYGELWGLKCGRNPTQLHTQGWLATILRGHL